MRDESSRPSSSGSGASTPRRRTRQEQQPRSASGGQPSPPHQRKDDGECDPDPAMVWADDETITRLEGECAQLTAAMSKLRKYTQEWFSLETRLGNATEDLLAAREDRDLHAYLGAPEDPSGDDSGSLGAVAGRGSDGIDDDDGGYGGWGTGIPRTVFFATQKPSIEGNFSAFVESGVGDGGGDFRRGRDGQEGRDALRLRHRQIERQLREAPKFSPGWFVLKEELVELSIELDEDNGDGGVDGEELAPHDKPEEIQVAKEQPGGNTSNTGGAPRVLHALSGKKKKEKKKSRSRRSKGGSRQSKPSEKEREEHREHPFPPYPPLSPPFLFRPISPRSLSPIPRPSPSPYPTSASSSTTRNSGNSCLSPYHGISNGSRNGGAGASHRRSASDNYRKLLLGGGRSSDEDDVSDVIRNEENINNIQDKSDGPAQAIAALEAQHSAASEELRRLPQFSEEWFDVKTQTVKLEGRIKGLGNAATPSRANKYDLSSSRSTSPSPSSAGSDAKNRSGGSGWTSAWSESEEEIMSYADDLERAMVAEALKRHGGGEEARASPPGALMSHRNFAVREPRQGERLMVGEEDGRETKQSQLVNSAVKIQARVRSRLRRRAYAQQRELEKQGISAVKIQAYVRGRLQCNNYNRQREKAVIIQSWQRGGRAASKFHCAVLSVLTIQCAYQRHRQRLWEQQQCEVYDASEALDSMLAELVPLLGDEEDAELERQTYHAQIIQEQWRNYIACRPVVSLRRRAVVNQGLVCNIKEVNQEPPQQQSVRVDNGQQQQQQKYLQQQPNGHSKWHVFLAVLIQGLWRGYRARKRLLQIHSVVSIQGSWRGYCSHKRYRHAKSSVAKMQSAVRGGLQRKHYARLREKAIFFQSCTRKELANMKFKRAQSSIVVIQRFWKKGLSNKALAALAAEQRHGHQMTSFELMFDEMAAMLDNEGDDEFERHTYYAVIIQDKWRNRCACRLLVSMRKQALQYQTLARQVKLQEQPKFTLFAAVSIQAAWRQNIHRRKFQLSKSTAVRIQAMVRSKLQYYQYNKQLENCIFIQSFLRTRWLATERLYTSQREVLFHSNALGIRLQRGKDGFVRVLSVKKEVSTDGSFSIKREGRVAPGDLVIGVAGLDLSSPVTNDQWGSTIEEIRNGPRPIKFVVASGTRRSKLALLDECRYVRTQLRFLVGSLRIQHAWRKHCVERDAKTEYLQASIVIQSHMRRLLARSLYVRELETVTLLAECEEVMIQLKSLQASTVIQSHARQRLARLSFDRKRGASIHVQAFSRMSLQKRRYMQTLTNVALVQAFARGWLARRKPTQFKCGQASTVIQSHAQQWLARPSFIRKRGASIHVQAFSRMGLQKRRYMQTLMNVALIQAFARGWLARRKLAQLKSLQASTVIQSHARQWLARSSFIRKRWASIYIQAFSRMSLQKRPYMQTLTKLALIQAFARGWLARRKAREFGNAESPSLESMDKQVDALAIQLSQMQGCNQEWVSVSNRLNAIEEELHKAKEMEYRHDAEDSRSRGESKENFFGREESVGCPPATNFHLLCERFEKSGSLRSSKKISIPNQLRQNSQAETPNIPQVQDGVHRPSSVAHLREVLEATDSKPVFPQTQAKSTRNISAESSQALSVNEACPCEMRSPENEVSHIHDVAKCKQAKNHGERTVSVQSTTPTESIPSAKLSKCKKKHPQKKAKLTAEQKLRNLSAEFISLSKRMQNIPKFSPEWTLCRCHMKLITDELEFVYTENQRQTSHWCSM